MKKMVLWITLFALLVGAMLPVAVNAESKYDGFTWEQLQEEYLAILQAMWETDKWEKVEVPAGVYQVGVEIPAGEWSISSNRGFGVFVGKELDITKTKILGTSLNSEFVDEEDYPNGWTVNLEDGMYITLSGSVVFSVPVKGQGFTFK